MQITDGQSKWERTVMDTLRVPRLLGRMSRGRWVSWTEPKQDSYKLNTDGSKKGDKTTGGEVIRDANGDFVYGFSHQYKHSEIIHAELQAIIDGLIHAHHLGMEQIIVETDSSFAYHMIRQTQTDQWNCTYPLR